MMVNTYFVEWSTKTSIVMFSYKCKTKSEAMKHVKQLKSMEDTKTIRVRRNGWIVLCTTRLIEAWHNSILWQPLPQ